MAGQVQVHEVGKCEAYHRLLSFGARNLKIGRKGQRCGSNELADRKYRQGSLRCDVGKVLKAYSRWLWIGRWKLPGQARGSGPNDESSIVVATPDAAVKVGRLWLSRAYVAHC